MIEPVDDDTLVVFEQFVREVRPRLNRALSGFREPESVADAVAEALAYAWENWEHVGQLANPAGYLFRVAQSKARRRREGRLRLPAAENAPEIRLDLVDALRALPRSQRACVWMVHACGWSYAETGEALGYSTSAVGTHISRGMDKLRRCLATEERNAHD